MDRVSNSESSSLFTRASARIPGGVNSPVRAFRGVGGTPFFTVRAHGPYLETADGRTLIDFVGTWGPAIHGHNHPQIREAVAQALAQGTSFGTPSPREVAMAETLCHALPSMEKVRLCNSGTEATMSCIRLARGFTGRDKVVKFAGCYHGHVDSLLVKAGSGALTLGHPDSAGIPPALAAETLVLPFNDRAAVTSAFAQFAGSIAAVILEPYPANVGLILPDPGFLEFLRETTSRHGSLLIFDEVMTGFRLGWSGVQGMVGLDPDLTALGKIIGGGLPVGAFGGKAGIMDCLAPLGPVYQAGTLSGNPLAMAAGLSSLEMLQADPPYQALEEKGAGLRQELLAAASRLGLDLQVPQTGSMWSVFFAPHRVTDLEQAMASDTARFRRFFHAALEGGVFLPPSPFETAFISKAHSPAVMEEATRILVAALAEAAS